MLDDHEQSIARLFLEVCIFFICCVAAAVFLLDAIIPDGIGFSAIDLLMISATSWMD